jgi:hypothetical protein
MDMRPQDIAIILKTIAKGGDFLQNKDLAAELFLSRLKSLCPWSAVQSPVGLIPTRKKCISRPLWILFSMAYILYSLLFQWELWMA